MNIWAPRLVGSRFLDLFAGSGAVGLEALSRGAAEVVLVDADGEVLEQLRENCHALGSKNVRVIASQLPRDVGRLTDDLCQDFQLIFADPPYEFDSYPELLLAAAGWLAPSGQVAVEHDGRQELPGRQGSLRKSDQRRYGDSHLSFYEIEQPAQD